MVSDIVLLKELADFIKESVEAYIACVSGAIKKNGYLKAIKASGFQNVKVVDEFIYPLDAFINDSAAKVIMDDLEITVEQVTEISASIASIKVYGLKPE